MFKLRKQAEPLLQQLQEQRYKQDSRDEMLDIVSKLIQMGEYKPTLYTLRNSDPVEEGLLEMVEAYGAYWHIWSDPNNCPHCDGDLCDRELGPPFKREIGIYQHDRTAYYKCPHCNEYFNRFAEGHPYHLSELKK